jgi:hypothetical protein
MVFDTGAGERMAWAKANGLFPLYGQSEEGVNAFANTLTLELGGNRVITQAEVSGTDADGAPVRLVAWVGFEGMNSKTALVTAVIVKRILAGGPTGVYHIEEYVEDPAEFIRECQGCGFELEYHPPTAS